MSLKARVSYVKRVKAGEAISYGLHHVCEKPTVVATVRGSVICIGSA